MFKKLSYEKLLILVVSLIFTAIVGYDLIVSKNSPKAQNEAAVKIESEKDEDEAESEENGGSSEDSSVQERPAKEARDKILKHEKISEKPDKNYKKQDIEGTNDSTKKGNKKISSNAALKNDTNSKKKTSNVVNINTASEAELSANLKGIGEAKAKLIVLYRKEKGNFTTIEEIKNVKGIGEKTFENIRAHITV